MYGKSVIDLNTKKNMLKGIPIKKKSQIILAFMIFCYWYKFVKSRLL